MDLKKQKFQLTNLTTKLKTLDTQLTNLQTEKTNLLTSQNTTTSQQTELQNQLDKLTSRKNTLLDTLKTIKSQINVLSREKNSVQIAISDLPRQKKADLDAEQIIQQEEFDRIVNTTIEVNNEFMSKIYNEYDNKNALEQDIIVLRTDLELQTNLLSNIQETVHASRHNILDTLKQKKQDKLLYQKKLDTQLEKQNFISSKLNTLQSKYNSLTQLKGKLIYNYYSTIDNIDNIDKYYSNSIDRNIDNYNINIVDIVDNIQTFLQLSLNEKIQYITDKLSHLDKQIKKHNLLLEKEISEYNSIVTQHNANEKQSYIPKRELKTSNPNYKDIFKHEKQVKSQLETILSLKTDQHINYNDTVIMQRVIDFKKEKDTLESDNQRAIDRLNIMTERINITYTSKGNALQSQIDTITEKLTSFKQQMDNINTEIASLDIQMKSQCSLILQINELTRKIEKIKSQISQVTSDISTLSSN